MTRASAGALPFDDAAFCAVLGLCVLDVVDQPETAVRELWRVLRPGGRVIHFLDMSTVLSGAFALLSRSDLVPLPNVFGAAGQRWPEDLLLLPRAELRAIEALPGYVEAFSAQPFELERALREYTTLAESREQRALLKRLLSSAHAPVRAQPVSSARFFETRLKALFTAASAFEVEHSDVATSFELRLAGELAPLRYLAMCVGKCHEQQLLPAAYLDAAAPTPSESETLVELGVYVFVARRL